MAICLPGIASSVKRAATSATRSAPLVITINCTRTMIRKMITPRIMFPCVIRLPNARITEPALPPLPRICRVVDTFKPSRNRVVISSSEGNMENSSASEIFMVIIRIKMDNPMLTTSKTSISQVGRGMIRNKTMITTISEIAIFVIRFMPRTPSALSLPALVCEAVRLLTSETKDYFTIFFLSSSRKM